ncbi:FecR family protein [Pedobacter nyackensis]|uniref:FecR family protein n=1 Tax=Pedobacter nyackensis TaxID=475255 RepID=UPI00292FDAAF|nr:FecR domain-containing protein [Pedobacter nyackensis]
MDNINSPKHNKSNEWIQDLLDEELYDEAYKFELVTNDAEELTASPLSAGEEHQKSFNSADAWDLFKNNVDTGTDQHPKIVPLGFRWMKYAAIIALPLLVGSVVYFSLKNNGGQENSNYQATTKNHSKDVMLVLENGDQVNLKKSENATVLNDNIINSADQLDYTKSSSTAAFNTLIVPKGASYKLLLDDGTQVWLNADTKIKYQVNFDNTSTREVYLESGEAFFKVTKNPEKPFIVHKGDMQIQVLGTSFNVNTYSEKIQTTLVEGKVKIGLKNTNKELILNPGQQANANLKTTELSKQNVDPELFVVWKDGILMINNTTMEMLMEELGRLYDYQIVFENEELKKLHYDGSTEKSASIKPLLDMIEKTTNVKFTIKDRRIIVKKDN